MTQQNLFPDDDPQPIKQQRKRRTDLCDPLPDELLAPPAMLPENLMELVRFRETTDGPRKFKPPRIEEIRRADGSALAYVFQENTGVIGMPNVRTLAVGDWLQLVAINVAASMRMFDKAQHKRDPKTRVTAQENWCVRYALLARHYHRKACEALGTDPKHGMPFEPETER